MSGLGTCSPAATYSGPDSATASVSGTCTDRAGNTSAPLALGLKYDSTPPQAIAAADRGADANGWFNHALTIMFQQAPGDLSGPDTCTASIGYSGPDDAAASRSGTCTDRAGNRSAAASLTFKYDGTAPGATATVSRVADANGWYNRPLTVSFAQAGGDLSGPDTCTAAATYSGPDDANASRSGTCTDRAGNRSAPAAVSFKYDSTAPQAVASTDRAADANGWFNHALTISFAQAAGDVSGPDTCSTAVSYGGARHGLGVALGDVYRSRGKPECRRGVRAQVRRHASGRGRLGEQACRRERLVQPRAHDLVRTGRRRPLRPRYLHRRSYVLRPGRRLGLALGHVYRPGRQQERVVVLRIQVRRYGPVGDRRPCPTARRKWLVQPSDRSRGHRFGRALGDRGLRRCGLRRAGTGERRRSPAAAPMPPGTRARP